MSEARKILVTSALPYANGSIHLGHMLEYIQTDMWVRFQKLRGNQAIYVCADDAHGSAIMLRGSYVRPAKAKAQPDDWRCRRTAWIRASSSRIANGLTR